MTEEQMVEEDCMSTDGTGLIIDSGLMSPNDVRGLYFPIYRWEPKRDITVYELALCVPVIASDGWLVADAVRALPSEAQRHFVEVNQP